jgi:hypothetical protein
MNGDRAAAARMGVEVEPADRLVFAPWPWACRPDGAFKAAGQGPGPARLADAVLVRRVRKLLARYGHAEYVTDAAQYRPAHGAAAAA